MLEIGCGPAVFSLLACRAGAKRVYAIETEDIIDVARQIVFANEFADRIHFFQSDSRATELPERVDVIVSDIRGALPLFDGAVATLQDARQRFLSADGVMIPRREVLRAAIIQTDQIYSTLVSPWKTCANDVELSIPLRLVLNSVHGVDAKPEAVSFYEQFGFAPLEVVEGQSQATPAVRAMFLSLREIAAAIK